MQRLRVDILRHKITNDHVDYEPNLELLLLFVVNWITSAWFLLLEAATFCLIINHGDYVT